MDEQQKEPKKQSQGLHDIYFSDMHLRVGEPLVMQSTTVLNSEPLSVNFIGAHGQLSFLTTLPSASNQGMWITPSSTFKFRVVHGMYAYAFTSRCLRAHTRPYPYAHFAVPENVKYRQVRQSLRLEMRLPVEVFRGNGSRTLAIMRDLSEHGAKLELTGVLDEVGMETTLAIPIILPGLVSSINVTATIRNSGDKERAMAVGRFHYGVSFAPLTPEEGTLLQHFIKHMLVEQLM